MGANKYGLPKTLTHHETGESRVVRTAVDYHNMLAAGYQDKSDDKPAAVKVQAIKPTGASAGDAK